ncbi:hypothetical protein [Cohnella sp.]|uniref:hypothetical protein n=1 Tax=Cohnella sp. TaxID=1883426 RepID=UPI003704A6F8
MSLLQRMAMDLGVTRPIEVTHDTIHDIILIKREKGDADATIDKYLRGWRFLQLHDGGGLRN